MCKCWSRVISVTAPIPEVLPGVTSQGLTAHANASVALLRRRKLMGRKRSRSQPSFPHISTEAALCSCRSLFRGLAADIRSVCIKASVSVCHHFQCLSAVSCVPCSLWSLSFGTWWCPAFPVTWRHSADPASRAPLSVPKVDEALAVVPGV